MSIYDPTAWVVLSGIILVAVFTAILLRQWARIQDLLDDIEAFRKELDDEHKLRDAAEVKCGSLNVYNEVLTRERDQAKEERNRSNAAADKWHREAKMMEEERSVARRALNNLHNEHLAYINQIDQQAKTIANQHDQLAQSAAAYCTLKNQTDAAYRSMKDERDGFAADLLLAKARAGKRKPPQGGSGTAPPRTKKKAS